MIEVHLVLHWTYDWSSIEGADHIELNKWESISCWIEHMIDSALKIELNAWLKLQSINHTIKCAL